MHGAHETCLADIKGTFDAYTADQFLKDSPTHHLDADLRGRRPQNTIGPPSTRRGPGGYATCFPADHEANPSPGLPAGMVTVRGGAWVDFEANEEPVTQGVSRERKTAGPSKNPGSETSVNSNAEAELNNKQNTESDTVI